MALDYSKGCVNFRDVGDWVNTIANTQILPVNRILRGGKINFIASPEEIGTPGTIFNLRKGADPEPKRFAEEYFHFPISNDFEKYDTSTPEVRSWLQDIVKTVETRVTRFPLFIHCTSGKDRTGVVVATLLSILGIDREIIIEEYLLSDGDVNREWIERTLEGISDLDVYFRRVDLDRVRHTLRNTEPSNSADG